MAERLLLREMLRRWRPNSAASSVRGVFIHEQNYYYSTTPAAAGGGENSRTVKSHDRWLILPPFDPVADGSAIGKKLLGWDAVTDVTALKWILKCYPHLPRSFVQKLFRLRQVYPHSRQIGSLLVVQTHITYELCN